MPSGYTPLFCALVVRVSATQHAVASIAEVSSRALRLRVIGRRPLRLKVGEPAQGAQSRHEAVPPAARDHKVGNSLNSSSYRLTRNRKISAIAIRSRNWISVLAAAKKDCVIDPL